MTIGKVSRALSRNEGVAAVELALVLPILLIVLFGMIDFGLYFYNDLQLTHVARDAARYLSVGDESEAQTTISNARLISIPAGVNSTVVPGTQGDESRIELTATYETLTPLPAFVGIGSSLGIDATAIMRRE